MSRFTVDYSGVEKLKEALERYGGKGAEAALNDVLHNQAGDIIANAIVPLIHPSGRMWIGKAPSATSVMPFEVKKDQNLSVTVGTLGRKKTYQYLYFPDDGSNTYSHIGSQDFMGRGLESQQERIIDLCVQHLADAFEIR